MVTLECHVLNHIQARKAKVFSKNERGSSDGLSYSPLETRAAKQGAKGAIAPPNITLKVP